MKATYSKWSLIATLIVIGVIMPLPHLQAQLTCSGGPLGCFNLSYTSNVLALLSGSVQQTFRVHNTATAYTEITNDGTQAIVNSVTPSQLFRISLGGTPRFNFSASAISFPQPILLASASNGDTVSLGTGGTARLTVNDSATTDTGTFQALGFLTTTNCNTTACVSATAGSTIISGGSTGTVITTTGVTANSQILLTENRAKGAALGVTCNTQSIVTLGAPFVRTQTAATSFEIDLSVAPTSNPYCVDWHIIN